MNKLISILKVIIHTFFWPLLIYGLFLMLNEIQGLIIGVLLLILCFIVFCMGFIGLLKGNISIKFKYKRRGSFLIVSLIAFSTTFFSVTNYILDSSLSQSLSARVKNHYYVEALLVEKDRIFERISFLKTLKSKADSASTIFYEKTDDKLAAAASVHIRKVQAYLDMGIDNHKPVPVTIILYRNPLIFQKHLPRHSYENLQALYVPSEETIHLLVTKQMDIDKARYLELIGHEYTHHWIVSYLAENGMDNRHLPRWFEEGIAEYTGKQSVRKVPNFTPLNLLPFSRLDSVEEWAYENRRNSPHLPYRQSYYAIDQLVRDGKEARLKNLLLNKKENFYKLFQKEIGMSVIEFEVRFLRDEMRLYRETRGD
ncbi:hypothetical protein AWM68_03990 [Fictibacillus phosphorivorans]|uniref:Peptidase MA-like domain-containing protein n=1 Tax=Fictibacillus phosphorivorans TaxID=1221500 RepID=A0A161TJK1_9BACL|nr:hypothetical protein [Fictibacillus phosphorivorans]KZE69434.1 hypothetical protein AWM68_03990 [Fictibacillus phosphorivorans]